MTRTLVLVIDPADHPSGIDRMLAHWRTTGAGRLGRACKAKTALHAGPLATAPEAELYLWVVTELAQEKRLASNQDPRTACAIVSSVMTRMAQVAQSCGALAALDSFELRQWLAEGERRGGAHTFLAARRELLPRWAYRTAEYASTPGYVLTDGMKAIPEMLGEYVGVLEQNGFLAPHTEPHAP